METLKKQAAKLLGEQKKYRRWLAVFLCLAIAVTAGTTAALKMNGQALSHEKKVLACGEKVHVHMQNAMKAALSLHRQMEKVLLTGNSQSADMRII